VILAKLEVFDEEILARARIGARYSELLSAADCETPFIAEGCRSVFAQYTIRVRERERFAEGMRPAGIPTAVHYPITLDQQPALADRCRIAGDLGHAAAAAEQVISLPMHPYLSETAQDQIVAAARQALQPRN
jgi:UDP-2-acetamido-2-deoxy-ribo-hexuluronate aminotransferase